jgi:high-affinity iron transporter
MGRSAGAAAGLSLLVAGLLFSLGARIEGRSEEVFEGVALLFAAVLLTWMIFWTRRQARSFAKEIESNVLHEVASGGKRALFLLAFIAILREGLSWHFIWYLLSIGWFPNYPWYGCWVDTAASSDSSFFSLPALER